MTVLIDKDKCAAVGGTTCSLNIRQAVQVEGRQAAQPVVVRDRLYNELLSVSLVTAAGTAIG